MTSDTEISLAYRFRSAVARAVDWIFGYDFFISYSWKDGLRLPREIRDRLEQAGFRVFLDQTEYVAGLDLRKETRRQVLKSRKLVVIGRPAALKSEWVKREVEVALSAKKTPVLVDVNNSVANAPEGASLAAMAQEQQWLRLEETLSDPDGSPTDRLISELVRGFNHTRQETKRQRVLVGVALFLAVSAGVAVWQAIIATQQREEAQHQQQIAEDQRKIAVASEKKAEAERDRANEAAIKEQTARELAEERRKDAERQKQIAEKRMRIAQAQQLAAQSSSFRESLPQRSLLLAVAAIYRTTKTDGVVIPAAEESLLESLSAAGGIPVRGHERYVISVAFSPDGRRLASGSGDRTVRISSAEDPQASPVVLRGHEESVHSVAFSPDGRRLASGSGDKTVRIWNAEDPKAAPVVLRGHKDYVFSVAFSPDGKRLASGSGDKTVRIWNVEDPQASPVVLRGHEESVHSVAFSPDGRRLASGSGDKTVRIWSVEDPKAAPVVLRGHERSVISVAFSPDGRRLASGSLDRTVRIWSVDVDQLCNKACEVAGRNLTCDEWQLFFTDEPYSPICPDLPYPKECGAKR